VRPLDLAELGSLTFEPVDDETFSCLRLARDAGIAGGTAPCILNAANEVAVHAFLDGRLRFAAIAEVIEQTLQALGGGPVHSFDSLAAADGEARRQAGALVAALTSA
jgi:1-deoxy-D-xylulose-5-phosphate reductoisomerase